jgi:hypothetical protein
MNPGNGTETELGTLVDSRGLGRSEMNPGNGTETHTLIPQPA